MIEQLSGFPENVLAFAGHGRVTDQDYKQVLIPAVESRLAAPGRLRLYYEVAADFAGIDPAAMVDDFKIGIEQLGRWERLALVSDETWIRNTVRAFGFLIPAAVRAFSLDDADEARRWISAPTINENATT